MFVHNVVFLAFLATSAGQSGIPRYIQGQWIIADENPQYIDTDGLAEERIWPESPPEAAEVMMAEVQNLLTTPEPYALKEQGIPRYIQGQWIIADENPQYEDTDGLAVEERLWPESPPEAAAVQNLLTTPEPYALKEQDSDEGDASAVWKIILVVAILLVSIVGFVCMAYYLCVWRGGRIYYRPQKGDNA